MSIKIKRNTGWVGRLPKFNIMINGEKVEKIKNNDAVQIKVLNGEAALQVSQWGVKSNEITVSGGDKVEIYTTWWGKYSIFLFLFVLLLMNLYFILGSVMTPTTFNYILPIFLTILFIGTALGISGLHYDIRKL